MELAQARKHCVHILCIVLLAVPNDILATALLVPQCLAADSNFSCVWFHTSCVPAVEVSLHTCCFNMLLEVDWHMDIHTSNWLGKINILLLHIESACLLARTVFENTCSICKTFPCLLCGSNKHSFAFIVKCFSAL